jgi:hypothetical protein
LEDGDGNEVKQTTVWVEQNEYIFSALADPSAAGTITLKKAGAEISNPYPHKDADVEITATAAANEGWTFDSWNNGESEKETTYTLHDYNEELRANFLRNIQSSGAWYYNSSMDFYSTEDFGGTSSPVNNGNVLNSPVQAMTYYNGKLYYAAEYSAGISRVYSEDFDNLGVSAPVVVDEMPGYGPFYTICYSYADSYFYTVAYDNGSSKVKLIRIESDGTGYNLVGEISNESSTIHTIASAVSMDGKLYILRASGSVAPAMLYELDPSTLAETLIGSTGVYADPGDYSTHTMVFDYATDELLWLTPNGDLYLVDTKTGLADLAKNTNIMDCNALFRQVEEHSVSLKVKEGQEE